MATYCAGILIAELRKRKGLSQEKLAEGICDRRSISYIENGRISPSKYVFEHLMERLGVDPLRFSNYISSMAELQFETRQKQIVQLMKEKRDEEVEEVLQSLEEDKKLYSNKFVQQYVMKTRAWLLAGKMTWANASDSQLPGLIEHALALTVDAFDITKLSGQLYNLVEIDLIRMLGLHQLYTGNPQTALDIFTELDQMLSTGYIFSQDHAATHTALLVTLAKSQRWLNHYQEALDTSERGINICTKEQTYRALPWLLYQKAMALYLLAQKDDCINVLHDTITLAKHYQEIEFLEFVEKRLEEICNAISPAYN